MSDKFEIVFVKIVLLLPERESDNKQVYFFGTEHNLEDSKHKIMLNSIRRKSHGLQFSQQAINNTKSKII